MAEIVSNEPSITWESLAKHTVTYHVLPNQQPLQSDILLPPSLDKSKSHPLILAFHGGGLIGGDRAGYEFMSNWLPAYAERSNAIIISSDYRLLPKATGKDIRDDLDALWKYVHSSLNSDLNGIAAGHEADLSRILVEGGSAGGFCAAHLALSHPDQIRGAILVYPMVDGFHEQGLIKQKIFPAELVATSEQLVVWVKEQKALDEWTVIRNVDVNYLMSLFNDAAGYIDVFGPEKDSSPAYRVSEEGDAKSVPARVWIFHGLNDSMVPSHYSKRLFETMKARGWSSNVRLTIVEDGNTEHGFDGTLTLKDAKLADNLSWVDESWLK